MYDAAKMIKNSLSADYQVYDDVYKINDKLNVAANMSR